MTISELYIYPIKSLGGISVPEVMVEEKGFRYDRRFMLVTPEGEFMTQRTCHQMALIDVAIQGEKLCVWYRHLPDDVLELPLSGGESTETMLVTVWDSKDILAQVVSAEADRWFSKVLGTTCRLVFMPETTHRAVDPTYALDNDAVSFADGYPYLLISQASLDTLNQRLAEPVSMLRFRPNVVVEGSLSYEEDSWAEFRVGDLDFFGVKPCARCVLTTIDPETGVQGKEPLRTLTTYRKWNAKILFGQNVLAKSTGNTPLGIIRVGQSVDVLRYQEAWLAPPALTV
ncbi:MOSC domain-containing protein [Spirosoma sp. HMF3257]|uniref:MOSC domain-containing protein n=1 Tax=Spirosoma telluris TaxID=2183553 RepID=A0A327NQZ3_9BACT|nr:MOSC domain-containing protein [Spirosoma telluris]RAI77851.1 MOSC domain-containing protein [Spirosoma telluris]